MSEISDDAARTTPIIDAITISDTEEPRPIVIKKETMTIASPTPKVPIEEEKIPETTESQAHTAQDMSESRAHSPETAQETIESPTYSPVEPPRENVEEEHATINEASSSHAQSTGKNQFYYYYISISN